MIRKKRDPSAAITTVTANRGPARRRHARTLPPPSVTPRLSLSIAVVLYSSLLGHVACPGRGCQKCPANWQSCNRKILKSWQPVMLIASGVLSERNDPVSCARHQVADRHAHETLAEAATSGILSSIRNSARLRLREEKLGRHPL